MSEYYIVVTPFKTGKEYIYKGLKLLEVEWLKNQLKQLGHDARVEKTKGGIF